LGTLSKLVNPPVVLAPLVAIGAIPVTRARGRRLAVIGCATGLAFSLSLIAVMPHYAATLFPLVILLAVIGLRTVRVATRFCRDRAPVVWRWGGAVAYALVFASGVGAAVWWAAFGTWRDHDGPAYRRAEIASALVAERGDDVVLVRYMPGHDVHHEWVYNVADVDASPVVWAQDMGDAKNRKLLDYFSTRRAWLLTVDAGAVQIVPYAAR
jgi:hypothetical protein